MKRIEKNVPKIAPAPDPRVNAGIRVRQYDIEGNYLATYDSMHEAMKAIGQRGVGVWECIHGKARTCGGFQWRRADE